MVRITGNISILGVKLQCSTGEGNSSFVRSKVWFGNFENLTVQEIVIVLYLTRPVRLNEISAGLLSGRS